MKTLGYEITIGQASEGSSNVHERTRPDGYVHRHDIDRPEWFFAQADDFATESDARTFAAQFPKSIKLDPTTVTDGCGKNWWVVKVQIRLSPDGVNQGINETGLRRIRTLFKAAGKLGIAIIQTSRYGNSSPRSAAEYGWLA